MQPEQLAQQHTMLTRRYFLQLGVAGFAGVASRDLWAAGVAADRVMADAIAELDYLTADADFRTASRGKPRPDKLSLEERRAAGLTQDTWRLEVVADPESNCEVKTPLSKEAGSALTWDALTQMATTHAVRYLKVMTCLNVPDPMGMGFWEGIPLRDVIWKTHPTGNIRRVFFYGYHNNDEKQRFQSSLSINRVLEDPPGTDPVMLCYKLNGEWLSPERGGPVRMIVPEDYGFRNVKWLKRIVLTNDYAANDTYALKNNDVGSPMKTFARFVRVPESVQAGRPIAITGLAQSGSSGLDRVQYCVQPAGVAADPNDPYFEKADWNDARLLPLPDDWAAAIQDEQAKQPTSGFSDTGRPRQWPMRFTIAHWAAVLPELKPGKYSIRCRTIDAAGIAQPMPRPFRKAGCNAIQTKTITVKP